MDFVSGEKIQKIAQLFVSFENDIISNPYIEKTICKSDIIDITKLIDNTKKNAVLNFMSFTKRETKIQNPKIIYCHGHNINLLSSIIHIFNNPFILISHNSDFNIVENNFTEKIIKCPKLIKWYAQNVGYESGKIHFLPIGIANRMWKHGDPDIYSELKYVPKTENVFMNFQLHTNFQKRIVCYETMISKNIPFLPNIDAKENIRRMQKYKFCICPDGNGFDTHRLWEAFYTMCVPILLKNTFSEIVKKETKLPMILLNSWEEFDTKKLHSYQNFDFSNLKNISMKYYIKKIFTEL
jgi:hypothetical protein